MSIYNKFNSPTGVKTKEWGPHFWKTLFFAAMVYPVKIDEKIKCHKVIKNNYKSFFASLKYILPCIYCIESYRRFYLEIDIENYLDSRINLMKWIYIIKDRVNKKLIFQENEKYKEEKKKLLDKYKHKIITKSFYEKKILLLKSKIFMTKKSPPFKDVLEYYEQFRS